MTDSAAARRRPAVARSGGEAAEGSALRRRPRQARAQERVNRVLDTAEQIFAEIGYDAATTNLIATQAGTSIGSLYEFFPNKEAIARALAERYVEQIDQLYAALFVEALKDEEVDARDVVEFIVEGVDRFYREHPGAVPLLNGRLTSPELAEAGASVQIALEQRVESVFARRRPDIPVNRRHLMAVVVAEMSRALLVRADMVPLSQRRALVRELERAIVAYLASVEEELPPPS
jgi:AcrR family transcriptional regulator